MCEFQRADPADFFVYSDHVSSPRALRPAGAGQRQEKREPSSARA
jgi:hypothetical protein